MQSQEPAFTPPINIRGRQVALGPLRRDLIPLFVEWLNDFDVTRTIALLQRPMTAEMEEQWYAKVSVSERDVVFVVYDLPSLRPIGTAGLHDIDFAHGTAEFGILIGDKALWGRGYGTEAVSLTVAYGFEQLGLHNIMLRVFANNERAARIYERVGFRHMGVRREASWAEGGRIDIIYMDCLRGDFVAQS